MNYCETHDVFFEEEDGCKICAQIECEELRKERAYKGEGA